MKTAIPKPSKQSIIREARDYVMIAIGMILYGIGWTVFLLPNDITTGGVPGIASIVYWATGFPVQYTYFSINFFLLLLALKLLGMKFCIKTIFGVFTLTFFLSVIQKLTAGFGLLHDQPFMACVIGASFCGGGIGVAFSANGSTGGTDIIAAIINKYRDITLGRVVLNDLARELLAIMLIPGLVLLSRSTALGLCGATSMDFTLPVLQRSGGVEIVPAAIVHGFILSLLVPILMAFFSA